MKRIKKFYREHEDKVSAFCIGGIIGTVYMTVVAVKCINGTKIVHADLFESKGGETMLLMLTRQNGMQSNMLVHRN